MLPARPGIFIWDLHLFELNSRLKKPVDNSFSFAASYFCFDTTNSVIACRNSGLSVIRSLIFRLSSSL